MGKQKNFTEPRFVKSITIENKPPKWFLLTGFKTFAEANLRGCELYKYGKDEIGTIFVANNNSFAVKISENIINKLTQDEQTRLKVMPICTEIRPYVPPLYRFLEKEYVDEFFSTGKLKLTTFDNCAKHANKCKNDTEEGVATIVSILENGMRVEAKCGLGLDCYVLCTTMNYDEKMFKNLSYNSCFEITHPLDFANIITEKLERVYMYTFGPCSYMKDKKIDNTIYVDIEDFNKIGFQNENNFIDFSSMVNFSTKGVATDMLFLKNKDQYSSQHEYRFIWQVEDLNILENGFIFIPEAIKYCKRIK